jgi:hypothetical protein
MQWGNTGLGDVPKLFDIDGDSRADLMVWRASTGTWYWLTSSTGYAYAKAGSKQWGNKSLGDVPLVADVTGSGSPSLIVWRPTDGTWYWTGTGAGSPSGSKQFGNSALGDIPLLGEFDADGIRDIAAWRASSGYWYWLRSSTGFDNAAMRSTQWGKPAS